MGLKEILNLKDIFDAEGGLDHFLIRRLVGEADIEGDHFAREWVLKLWLYEEASGRLETIWSGIPFNRINDKTRERPFQCWEDVPGGDEYYLHSHILCLHAFNDRALYDAGNYGIYDTLTNERIHRGDVRALMSRGDELYALVHEYGKNEPMEELLSFEHFKRIDVASKRLIDVPELKAMSQEEKWAFQCSLRQGASLGYHFCNDNRKAILKGDLLRAVLEKALSESAK